MTTIAARTFFRAFRALEFVQASAGRFPAESAHKYMYDFLAASFEWDEDKNRLNQEKHGISFEEAQHAFADPARMISVDDLHSTVMERRYHCFGRIETGVVTIRFTLRGESIRIIGAGFWRKGRKAYEAQQK